MSRNVFCTTGVGRHLKHPEIEKKKKIVKESKKSEIIDGERKSWEKMLGYWSFDYVQITWPLNVTSISIKHKMLLRMS